MGNLQKGHGVSFADFDNDGNEDIYIKMGGAYIGDDYENSLYLNPGQNQNHWINLSLPGMVSNRAAIGAKVRMAVSIEKIEVTWPVTGKVQVFENPPIDTNLQIKETDTKLNAYKLARFNFVSKMHNM